MGKTSTSESSQTNEIDDAIRGESEQLMNLFKLLASQPPEINTGVTVAGFTPQQQAAFDMTQNAAGAFGFTPAATGMPATTTSALGIEGYAPGTEAQAQINALSSDYKDALAEFYRKIGGGSSDNNRSSSDKTSGDDSGSGSHSKKASGTTTADASAEARNKK